MKTPKNTPKTPLESKDQTNSEKFNPNDPDPKSIIDNEDDEFDLPLEDNDLDNFDELDELDELDESDY